MNIQMLMSNEVGALLIGILWATVMYRSTLHWTRTLLWFIRSENSRKAYWFCLSNEHHGYLKPAELERLKEESELDVRESLVNMTAFIIGWFISGIFGGLYFASL